MHLRLSEPVTLPCGLVLRNRVMRAAAFAGGDVASVAATLGEAALGGAAVCTLAYTSVSADGRTFAEQILLTPEGAPADLALVARAVHAHGALLSVQLTHAGGFAERALLPRGAAPLAPSAVFEPAALGWPRAADAADLERLERDFAAAAALAVRAGEADAVELHLGHGYLLSQWLCPLTNRRAEGARGGGGGADARAAFPVRVARAVRAAIGARKALIVKLNTDDGFAGGVRADDVARTVAALCAHDGLVDAFVPSAGFVSRNGFYMLRGAVPRARMARALARSSWLKAGALALLGRWLVPELPFAQGFLLEGARGVLRAVAAAAAARAGDGDARRAPSPLVFAVGGFVAAAAVEDALAEGFAGVQMARALIREPDLVRRWQREAAAAAHAAALAPSPCSHCNDCVVAALQGEKKILRCVERGDEIGADSGGGGGGGLPTW
jgi:2,4-dienoyl-CoA reductase-like NADH-dependent reductase (Old Yellow Enzyme family)